jgi:hypothetical protein
VRVYAGKLKAKEGLFNSSKMVKDRPTRLMRIAAEEMAEVDHISGETHVPCPPDFVRSKQCFPAGEIGAVMGLKHTQTGDTLLSGSNKNRTVLPSVEVLLLLVLLVLLVLLLLLLLVLLLLLLLVLLLVLLVLLLLLLPLLPLLLPRLLLVVLLLPRCRCCCWWWWWCCRCCCCWWWWCCRAAAAAAAGGGGAAAAAAGGGAAAMPHISPIILCFALLSHFPTDSCSRIYMRRRANVN